ncbi:MAG TPA: hypothetical protein VFT99_23445, partial [Roseiflexaceae bacterium]|nr:hypothetical protein [Roseiflexaceae bacterium]
MGLAERLKNGNLAKLGPAPLTRIRDLAVLETADWLTLLQQAEVEPPDGMQREEYARVLAHKLAALYPTDAFMRRLPTIEPDRLRSDIEQLEPLFAGNQALFTSPGWRPSIHAAWDSPEAQALLAELAAPAHLAELFPELAHIDTLIQPVDLHPYLSTEPATLAESTTAQEAYARLDYVRNLYPGLGLGDILDNPKLASTDKARCVAERIMLLQRVREQNEDLELLLLDYTRDSKDIAALKLDSLAKDERRRVLSTLRAYRRAYALANDVDHARTMLGAGFHSALAIVNAGFDAFARGTRLSEPVARACWKRAQNMTIAAGAGMGALVDGIRGGFDTLHISNLQSAEALDDYEELFGSQTYCDCKHCQSILSPAA